MTSRHYGKTPLEPSILHGAHTRPASGFSLIELMLVVAIAAVVFAMALPQLTQTMRNMHLGSSSATLSSAIQAARYQAIQSGCPITMTVSTGTYLLAFEKLKTTGGIPQCDTVFTNDPRGSLPWASSDIALVGAPQTMEFNPSGTVSITGVLFPNNFTIQIMDMPSSASKTISISGVGSVKVTAP